MAQALIKINAVAGSDDDLPINTLVQLANTNTGGETTYLWTILSQPPGAADALSSAVITNPTFTPKKEGTYLIQLIVNAGPLELVDTVVAAVRDLKTFERVPAPLEQDENDAAAGWAGAVSGASQILRRSLTALADPGNIVVLAGASGVAGHVVSFSGTAVLKTGLPGEETLPVVDIALATSSATATATLGYVTGTPSGASVSVNQPVVVRRFGLIPNINVGAAVVGDPIYLGDTGLLSTAPGTNTRVVGHVVVVGVTGAVYFDGAGAGAGTADLVPVTITTAGTYNIEWGQAVLVNTTDVVTVNLPASDPSKRLTITAAISDPGKLTIVADTGTPDNIYSNVGPDVLTSLTELVLNALPGVFIQQHYEVTSVTGAVFLDGMVPAVLASLPNSGGDVAPYPLGLYPAAGRASAAASLVGRGASPIILVGAAGGDYTGVAAGVTGGAGTTIAFVGGTGGGATGSTGGDGGAGGYVIGTGGAGGSVVGDGDGGVGGLTGLISGAGGAITGGGSGDAGASGAVTLGSGSAGSTDGTGAGGTSGAVLISSGGGGGSTGGVGGDSGSVTVDVGTATDGGATGILYLGPTNAKDIQLGGISTSRVNAPRIAEFDAAHSITATPATLRQYDLNILTGINALYTLTLPTLTGAPSQDGMACRVIFGVAGTGVGTITIVADTGNGDTALTPAITAIVPQIGTSFVFRANGAAWFLESRSY